MDDEKKRDLLYLSIRRFDLSFLIKSVMINHFFQSLFSFYLWEESSGDANPFKSFPHKEGTLIEEMYQEFLNADEKETEKDAVQRKYKVDFTEMKMLKPRVADLRRLSNQGLSFIYASSAHISQYHLQISSVQIDNQLSDHTFDVVFCPVSLPQSTRVLKRRNLENASIFQSKNFIEISAIVQSLASVTRFNYVQVMVQEFMIRAEWSWINTLQGLFTSDLSKYEQSASVLIHQDLETIYKVFYSNFF